VRAAQHVEAAHARVVHLRRNRVLKIHTCMYLHMYVHTYVEIENCSQLILATFAFTGRHLLPKSKMLKDKM
jgi:hypothetical protein